MLSVIKKGIRISQTEQLALPVSNNHLENVGQMLHLFLTKVLKLRCFCLGVDLKSDLAVFLSSGDCVSRQFYSRFEMSSEQGHTRTLHLLI